MVADARSLLFVPGSRPDRYRKAATSGADLVVVDLEDAVSAEDKSSARSQAADWLNGDGAAAVRVNAHGTEHHDADVESLVGCRGLRAVVVPMVESREVLEGLHGILGRDVAVIAQVETARGLRRADELAAAAGVVRLAFGHLDFAADLGADPDSETVVLARVALVVASRAAGLAAPVDSVTTDLDDPARVSSDAVRARRMGFSGKLCVHPRQIAAVNEAMSPTPEEITWAEKVLATRGAGAVRVDGAMVDAPVLARAEDILARMGRAAHGDGDD